MKRPVLLLIRDGWGFRAEKNDNATKQVPTPNTDRLMEKYPNILLDASGPAVGLPRGYQGNSEVGHMTIGSGRIIDQSMVRINKAISDGEIQKNESILKAIQNCKEKDSVMHIIGLLQDEGVHAHIDHLFAILDMCKENGLSEVLVHVITDGRDAPPDAAQEKLDRLHDKLNELSIGKVATISGRYYAMDRDKRWDRTQKAYDAIVDGNAQEIEPLRELYSKGETDEFLIPRKTHWYEGMKDDDSVIFYNFRTDRPRQLTKAIVEDDFSEFSRIKKKLCYVAMTTFYRPMNALVAFGDINVENILGEIVSRNGMKQLRISETEKYAHVTFFFNCQKEDSFEGEDRILIHSPKVATYDLKPEMSAYEITEAVIKEIDKEKHDLIVMNIVNGDMVGHTGIIEACHKAVQAVDECVGKITDKILEKDGVALVFADHGNIEDQTPRWKTSHTLNPIPLIVVSNESFRLKSHGGLEDVAPTALYLMGIEKPAEMSGHCLIEK